MTVTFLTAETLSEDVLKQDATAGKNTLLSDTNCLPARKESIVKFPSVFMEYF
jgi:hypothetical protein